MSTAKIGTTTDPDREFFLKQVPGWDDTEPSGESPEGRQLVLTSAADIKPRRVRWLWEGRLALGTLGLLAGREGVGKSSVAYWLASQITRGTLPGEHLGQPASVLICASEDSWSHTIVPRLIAAGADLTRVYRVEVISDAVHSEISMPRDLHALERIAGETGALLLLLDPLMSRLSDRLDTHRDAEVRLALEPLAAITDRAQLAVLGIIHHNKSASTDPLQLVMGSKAFTAVARSVHTVLLDPDDDTDNRRLFGTPKNNLGKTDLPTLAFTVASHPVDTDDGTAWTGRIEWAGESAASIGDAMRRAAEPGDRTATAEATEWLSDYLESEGGSAASADIKQAGKSASHSYDCLKRARQRLGYEVESTGFPRRTYWLQRSRSKTDPQSEQQSEQPARGESLTALTALTEGYKAQSEQSEQWEQVSKTPAPTGAPGRLNCRRCNTDLPIEWRLRGTCGPCALSAALRSA